ncbi:MAG: undecaprenyl-diphosphate phosphatase [Patescibacteria group bacterium]|nr:undecaprenyl-diphosphate phosphatase [Patescibacteria group bacterium]
MLFDLIKAIIYGLTQGLTEFLPVSSSGHLVLLHDFLAIDVNNEIAFDVVLHFGTLLAVLFYFRADILKIIKSFFVAGDKESRKLGIYLALATIPAGASGYFFDDIISTIFRSTLLVAFMLVLVGVLFIISERVASQKFNLSNIKLSQALIIGLAQTLALIPGTSRSGITIVVGLFLGLKREAAARYSGIV